MSQIHLTLERVAELRAMLGDADPDLIHDVLEGQTDVFELMDWALGKIADEETFQEAIASRISSLKERSKGSEGRVARLRGVLDALMGSTGERTVRRPEATVSLMVRKPAILEVDESLLPDQFWKETRTVSRSAINEAIKNGEVVAGVTMDNGGYSLTIRRK